MRARGINVEIWGVGDGSTMDRGKGDNVDEGHLGLKSVSVVVLYPSAYLNFAPGRKKTSGQVVVVYHNSAYSHHLHSKGFRQLLLAIISRTTRRKTVSVTAAVCLVGRRAQQGESGSVAPSTTLVVRPSTVYNSPAETCEWNSVILSAAILSSKILPFLGVVGGYVSLSADTRPTRNLQRASANSGEDPTPYVGGGPRKGAKVSCESALTHGVAESAA
jgi:hypothetical protein